MSQPRDALAKRERAFTSLYEAVYPDLVRFAQRRTHLDHAEDVVAEAFMVVWRRLEELPPAHDDARAWIFGIARHLLLNVQRGDRRRQALAVRLAEGNLPVTGSEADLTVLRIDLVNAWNLLSDLHQEALALAIFEQLDAPRAAAVIGISPVAFRLRLSRARRALRLYLNHRPRSAASPGRLPGRTPTS